MCLLVETACKTNSYSKANNIESADVNSWNKVTSSSCRLLAPGNKYLKCGSAASSKAMPVTCLQVSFGPANSHMLRLAQMGT
jgi:hypothetical protein